MASTSNSQGNNQTRRYQRAASVVFLKTKGEFGGLSNMAGGFALKVNGLSIFTSEALYQACRFPHRPEVQQLIIGQASPMTAKMKSKPYRHDTRSDWNSVRVNIMRWCLRVKLAQNWDVFSELLLKTGDYPIVEQSRKDAFWGAKETEDGTLVGRNVLGRLLMELREAIKTNNKYTLLRVAPLQIPDFLLDGQPIREVQSIDAKKRGLFPHLTDDGVAETTIGPRMRQVSLFPPWTVGESSSPRYVSDSGKIADIVCLKPYPSMKDSGVPWLGDVPEHWEVLPNRALFAEAKERNHPEEQMLSVTITKGVIPQQKLLEDSSKKDSSNLDKSAYKLVLPSDIVYNKMRAWQGAIGVSNYKGIVSPAYVIQRPRDRVYPRYFHYLLRTPAFVKEAERWSYGITSDMWSLRPEHFKMIYGCLPPLKEQTAIVRYLDYIDRRIQKYIRTKQKLIKLLEEQKQVIIHQAVTRGLKPNIRLKPSGIEWLGDILEHWDVTPGRNCFIERKQLNDGLIESTVLSLSYGNIVIKPEEKLHGLVPNSFETYQIVEPGDIICRATDLQNDKKSLRFGFSKHHGIITSAYLCFRTSPILDGYFGYLLLHTYDLKKIIYRLGSGLRQNLGWDDFKSLPCIVPPLSEQIAIVKHIDESTANIVTAIDSTRHEIELLREYHTRLNADVVTGKLDVCEVASSLLDEKGESETFDETEVDENGEEIMSEEEDDGNMEVAEA